MLFYIVTAMSVFPQYKDIRVCRKETAKEAARGNAYDDLNEMIGLASAKSVIIKALNYYKLQRSNAIRFIDTACFWDDFGKIRDLHYEGKPLLVKDVSPDIICSIQEYDRQIDRQKLLILQQTRTDQ